MLREWHIAQANATMTEDPLTLHLRALVADTVANAVEPAIEAALTRCLPEILRRAQRPALLSKKEVVELTGWSPRKKPRKIDNKGA